MSLIVDINSHSYHRVDIKHYIIQVFQNVNTALSYCDISSPALALTGMPSTDEITSLEKWFKEHL